MNLLKSLEMFRAVAEHESFTRAADELSLAQPPISRGVADLERHLGVRLFDRSRRRIRLTAAGRAVLPDVLEILRRIDGLAEVAGRREEGTLIGVHGRLDPAVLVSATKELRLGGAVPRFVPAESAALDDLIESGEIDAGLDVRGLGSPLPTQRRRQSSDLVVDLVVASTRFAGSEGAMSAADLRGMPPGMGFGRASERETIMILPEDAGLLHDSGLLTPLVARGIHLGQFVVADTEFDAVTHVFAHGSVLLCPAMTARTHSLPYRGLRDVDLARRVEVVGSGSLDLLDAMESPLILTAIARILGARSHETRSVAHQGRYADERLFGPS
ncbi:LysR family transcriptional regulator [Brevibacterium casei]|uniref:Ben and cat operon transcriptional regulator n=1 Tax=Brevibacterium casei TaxID=33889 RepID=A0A449DBQ4_9MICO|nr:LysR family transcriptional regulator [Brevibacterium casei]VEW14964.1 Ben and cat operon transcriptional regulator [Brevibacterium casei]